MDTFHVVEKFVSINGEAAYAGELACFIRFAGCNLNCGYCDTAWANKKDVLFESLTSEELYDYIVRSEVFNVTLTGGEPLLQPDIDKLLSKLSKNDNLRVEVETNGSIDVSSYFHIGDNIEFTIDYKLPKSGMSDKMCLDNFKKARFKDTVKFVVSDYNDLVEAKKVIDDYGLTDKTKVYLSSAFNSITPKDIVAFMIENNMNKVRIQLQMHKYIWEPDRKGV
ncbi:MAG: putative 7-carboxy-7-deazaguanine synthase QueE [Clostridium sp.]|nr:putative 7-carboxy-7-deazaguanine synthase QueE [Clostridium sp.]MCM1173332.1 putative 7-carboxy-7-deazaguanine synthase QueE [Clostridium sp.]MCM1209481.1 putative 7-carboxy-7-deazaguanine synthase QueE [Ruminococcus sp.]